jgi:hypothetical protein
MIRSQFFSGLQEPINLDQWLRYEDYRNAHFNPFHGAEVSLVDFHSNQDGSFYQPMWRKEEWLIRSAITPVHDAAAVLPQ